MKNALIIGLIGLLARTLSAAESDPQANVASATRQLGDKPNYSWTTTIKEGDGSSAQFPPVTGKTDKSGLIYLRFMNRRDPDGGVHERAEGGCQRAVRMADVR